MRNLFADFYKRKPRFLADFFNFWNIEDCCSYRKIGIEFDGILTVAIGLTTLMCGNSFAFVPPPQFALFLGQLILVVRD